MNLKVPYYGLEKLFELDCGNIEVNFSIDGDEKYSGCWFGYGTFSEYFVGNNVITYLEPKSFYWFGLVEDGSQAYDYDTFDEFVNAPVFRGKSFKEVWDAVTIHDIFPPLDWCE